MTLRKRAKADKGPRQRPAAAKAASAARADPPPDKQPSLIVGIGASAGGLSAFKTFFSNMPSDSGMAFVLVQHLDPNHRSMLVELLAAHTAMPVVEARHGAHVAGNHVFVIPPDATLTIESGALKVGTPAPAREHRRPIDTFFSSLARDQGEKAACIVLSGSGSDGSLGLRTIKEHGGLCLAQAEFDEMASSGMPQSAAATGLVDYVLPIQAMPARLVEYERHLAEVAGRKDRDGSREDMPEYLAKITALLRARIGHDFGQYKEKTLVRRIQRRMQILHIGTVPEYIEHLRKEPSQLEALFREFLIGVTEFFRESDAFEALQTTVIPEILARAAGTENQVRIWVPGCATGEEAYSIAIVLQETVQARGAPANAQIFGTDIDDSAVTIARRGCYRKTMTGVSPERLRRWFVEESEEYCVTKPIREMCIFSTHSIIKDPPFSRLDMISCRNLLIYLNADLQDRVLRTFHYALRPGGYLFLGASESVTRNTNLFAMSDKKHRIFHRRDSGAAEVPEPPATVQTPPPHLGGRKPPFVDDRIDRIGRRIVEKYSPAYLIIDEHDQIVRFSGGAIGQYLEPSPGVASLNLFTVLRKELRPAVKAAVQDARKGQQPVAHENITVKINGQRRAVGLFVEPISEIRIAVNEYCIVGFRDVGPAPVKAAGARGATVGKVVQALEEELRVTKAQLMTTLDQCETYNEEMNSANEEYQSVNEELQSTNEELETSKEEMQSINEELQTVNGELNVKNNLLTHSNSDLKNLLDSTQIATLFLDKELQIKSFTPVVTELFNMRDTDRGRPVTHLTSRLNYTDLPRDVEKVLRTLSVVEVEVSLAYSSETFIMRIRPYRTVEDVIDGVVITFVNISERHEWEARRTLLLQELNHRVKNTLATVLSIAVQTLKGAPAPEAFQQAFLPQIMALSKTHDLLTRGEWRHVTLNDLALEELAPYRQKDRSRWRIEGEEILLRPRVALALGLALHELATNAAKYGALSTPTGSIDLTWEVRSVEERRWLYLLWGETGGPPVKVRTRKGFGSRLIEEGLARELDGNVRLDFDPAGVRCRIDIPLASAKENS